MAISCLPGRENEPSAKALGCVRYLQKLGNEVRDYENYEDLLAKEKDLQAVLIATPDFWHAPMAIRAAQLG